MFEAHLVFALLLYLGAPRHACIRLFERKHQNPFLSWEKVKADDK